MSEESALDYMQLEEQLYTIFGEGAIAGELGMLQMMKDLGLINDAMKNMILWSIGIGEHEEPDEHIDDSAARETIREVMKRIQK